MFTPVDPKASLPQIEERLIAYWKEHKIFEQSIDTRPADKKWTFLDGPPFVTGMPHYGTLLISIGKDLYGRYWTMKGYRVRRVWGWDGHGLPIENKVENELQIQRKKDIEEKIGVKEFITRCLSYVNEVSGEWEWYIDHIGRWIDFHNAYKTWDLPYMESVMWVFKQMYDKGHIYKGLKNSLYCPHCSTPISNFEVAMDAENYKEVSDPSTVYMYQLRDQADTYLLAWSTTPWTKITTLALAVNPTMSYVTVRQGDMHYILAKERLSMLNSDLPYTIIDEYTGANLIGKQYVPHFDFFTIPADKKGYIVIGDSFVTADEGTGIVTIAPYGEEDLKVMLEHEIHIQMHLDEEGNVFQDIPEFGGMYYLKANKAVNESLQARGLIYHDTQLNHRVPLCWRCHTRLYYAAIDAWYVNVQDLKNRMKSTNQDVHWYPDHFKHGRFEKSLAHAPDWNISRNRYWGSPVPVWECVCGERFVPGSIKELEDRSGRKIVSLHKPEIDEVTVPCSTCGKQAHRVPEVLDSWIEAGSASFGERHYPFNNKESLEDFFPPDYIAEYTGQIRAWFYVLHVISNALFDTRAFTHVSVTGVILGTDGKKMSKNLKNYPDPKEMLTKYGGDALRLYLLGSPVMLGEDLAISEEQYKMQVRGTLLILWNVFNFFVMNANSDGWSPGSSSSPAYTTLDQWILGLLDRLITEMTEALERYDSPRAVSAYKAFVDDLSTWYIRRSRDRTGSTAKKEDADSFYHTTYTVLTVLSRLMAPVVPFMAEEIYRTLTNEPSVHLALWPTHDEIPCHFDEKEEEQMRLVRKIIEIGLNLRKESQIKVRQPLALLTISQVPNSLTDDHTQLIKDELNVKEVRYEYGAGDMSGSLDTHLTQELIDEGKAREIVRSIQEKRKELGTQLSAFVDVVIPDYPSSYAEYIRTHALVRTLELGEEFRVDVVA